MRHILEAHTINRQYVVLLEEHLFKVSSEGSFLYILVGVGVATAERGSGISVTMVIAATL